MHAAPSLLAPRPAVPSAVLHFAHYTLRVRERQLLAHGVPVRIGSRAFDLLLALARGGGQPVPAQALLQAAWPGQRVADNNLRVQLSGLRKLLGPGAVLREPGAGWRLALPLAEVEVQADTADEAEDSSPASAQSITGMLPALPSRLIGRRQEIEQAADALQRNARLTFVGPAGIGKTWLALHCAAQPAGRPSGGVWWVDLAGVQTQQGDARPQTAAVVLAVAAALQLKLGASDDLAELVQALADRALLLVLDNCEHAVAAVAALADALLAGASGVRLLATSRRALRCSGEMLLPIAPLSLPDAPGLDAARRSDALQLFEARVQRAYPRFELTADNVDAIADICRRLDGVALAITLAAARAPMLGLDGLRQYLDERLRLFRQREPVQGERHPSLMAALDWSHGLLSPHQQVLLRRLGVVPATFDETTAAALATLSPLDETAGLQALQVLVEHSLVEREPLLAAASAGARYRLHETVRLYARHQLDSSGEALAVRGVLARHLLAVLRGPAGQPARAAGPLRAHLSDADHDTLGVVLQGVAADGHFELALQLLIEAHPHLRLHGHHQDALRWGAQFLADARTQAQPLLRARLHLAQATICWEVARIAEGIAHVHAAQADLQHLPDEVQLRARAWRWSGILHLALRQHDVAAQALQQALHHDRVGGDTVGMATTLNNLGNLWIECGLYDEAQRVLEEAREINERLGLTWGLAVSLENLGELAYVRGQPEQALVFWQRSLPLMRELGHRYHEAAQLIYQAQALRRLGQGAAARAPLRLGLQIAREQRLQGLAADALVVAAALTLDQGAEHAPAAATLLHLATRERGERVPAGPIVPDLAEITAAVHKALGDDHWRAAAIAAAALSTHAVVV